VVVVGVDAGSVVVDVVGFVVVEVFGFVVVPVDPVPVDPVPVNLVVVGVVRSGARVVGVVVLGFVGALEALEADAPGLTVRSALGSEAALASSSGLGSR
jgi:hypothetical protein